MCGVGWFLFFFFFKQKTAYEMRISDWSSDVCSSDLTALRAPSAPFARDGSAGRSGGGSGRGLAELLAQPVVDQTLLVAQLVAVGQRRTALQVGDIGQLARKIGRASCRERVCKYV